MELYRGEVMKRSTLIWILLGIATLIPLVSADTISASRSVTLNGPSGILVPLGMENFMTLAQARYWYNWICVIILMPIAAYSSRRNHEQFAVFIPILAAILVGFGWYQTSNMIQTIGAIVAAGFIGAGLYMKAQLRTTFGIGGPGSTMMNIVVFMILLSAIFGLVNGQNIWRDNTGVQPNQFLNVDLESEVVQMSNAGGILDDILDAGQALLSAAIASLKVMIAIAACIVCFSGAVILMYPWVAQSSFLIGLLAVYQIAFYIMAAKFFNDVYYAKSIYATEF